MVDTSVAVRLEGVSRRYDVGGGEVYALRDVSLVIDEGEFVVVLGPSGSGKSTLLNMIGALDLPTEGTVEVGGQVLTETRRADLFAFRRSAVAFIFQTFNLFPTLTALENVQCAVEISGHRAGARERAQVALDRVGLHDRALHYPSELSGGEQQRVAIARALATGNPVLVADEPTGDLDYRTGVQVLEVLRQQAAAGHTVVVVTHNREISRVADRVIELSSGRIVSDGPPAGGRADVSELHW
ncbi:MAG: ABC transporter ATP-binding protein [Ilumatobacteraceae bacterium]|jgi:putative ABC transport system ATP-binding protein|nr:ABC transporter ATP-binding protein [Ilumatobacteraceae bacterium]